MVFQRALLFVAMTLVFGGCSSEKPAAPAGAAASAPAPTSTSAPRSCAFCPDPSPEDCTLCVASNPLLTVNKDGAASAALHLCNRGTAPELLDLTISDFHAFDPKGQSYPLSAVRTLSAVNSANNPILAGTAPLVPNGCVDVKIDATRLWQAGLSVADLQNGPTTILQLKAVRYEVPLNVRVEGQTEDGVTVLFTRGRQSVIRLRNEDGLAYQLLWRLELADFVQSGETFIAGHGLATLPVELTPTSFSLFESGAFRAGARVGTLTLAFAPGPDFGVLPLPHKQYPVAARLNYFPEVTQRATNYGFVLFVLVVGILLSLLVNQVLPAQKTRVAIKQQLAELEGQLAGFAGVIDSRLLNLLRVEKKRLRGELREQLPIFPQAGLELPKLEKRIEWLAQRIGLTARVGELLEGIETNQDNLAIPEADEIRMHCREVLDVVRKATAAADEIATAQKHLQLAEGIRDRAEDQPSNDAVQSLRDRAGALAATIPSSLPADSGWAACEDLLRALQKDLPPSTGTIDRVQYARKTRVVRQLELIVKFATLVDLSAGQEIRERRLARAEELLAALLPGRDASLAKAQDIVRQIDQNVTKADLQEEMGKPGTMRVEINPPRPFVYQLVTFRVRFDRPGLDSAAAQDEIECLWYIDGCLVEGRDGSAEARTFDADGRRVRGWIRGDYFPDGGVKWQDLLKGWLRPLRWSYRQVQRAWRQLKRVWQRQGTANGQDLVDDAATQGSHVIEAHFPSLPNVIVSGNVTVDRTISYVESRTKLAMASLSITVFIVALGLLAGAQERLQTLDWLSGALAVLALGFGADTLKTLMSKT